MRSHEREYLRLAAELSEWPCLITRILDQHNPTGTCRACTTPGGRMVIAAPCPPRQLAMHAQLIIFERAQMIGRAR
jgi:hypothetical protein